MELNKIPLPNNPEVKMIINTKTNLKKLQKVLLKSRDLTKSIKGSISKEISLERQNR
ncbi:MAG: hypothetical protein M3R36_18735 [Bacteroidota bacterium]|nr:hypothetical protein [Bacteroidota bacterium]